MDYDVRFSDNLAAYFIDYYTNIGEKVFEPFAGFGRTIFITEKLNVNNKSEVIS